MVVIGVDVGGATTNGISVVDGDLNLLYHTKITYDKKGGKGEHRRKVAYEVRQAALKYNADCVIVERIKQFKGDMHSTMANIESLVRIVCTIIDCCQGICEVFDVQVGSWKSQIIGHNTKDKQESIDFVMERYHIDMVHDEADSVCIATYGIENFSELMYDLAKNPDYTMKGSKCLTRV